MKKLLPFLLMPFVHAAPLSDEVIRNTAREIDEILLAEQKDQKITPMPVADDSTFVRRSYLNIIGRLPTAEEARSFLDSNDREKRADLIDTLIESPGMKSKLFNYWSDLLRVKTNSETSGLGWHVWLREAVETNMPYDKMVHAMLAANDHSANNPAAGYYLRDRGMLLDNISNTVQVFHGQQIGCAQCHDHPFDTTTQMEYYQLASFLAGTEYKFEGAREKIKEVIGVDVDMKNRMTGGGKINKKDKKAYQKQKAAMAKQKAEMNRKRNEAKDLSTVFRYHNRNALSDNPKKQLKLPEDYQYEDGKPGESIEPQFLFGKKIKDVPPKKRREVFADWATSRDNKYFSKVVANRLWAYTFGYGVVPALDDWSNSPDPLYPELVDYLESAMKVTNYDVQQYLRILYHTKLFQREVSHTEPTQGFAFDFNGPILRRMEAEEIRDSFVTLASGNIDDNTNYALKESWDNYVDSFQFVMNATPKQIREIDDAADKAELDRRRFQKETAEMRVALRKAQESGQTKRVQTINLQLRELRDKASKKYRRGSMSDTTMKAQAAVARRYTPKKSSHSPFQMRSSEIPAPQKGGTFVAEFGGSDRETPSSAHTEATVPQTLRLLNGTETAILLNKKGDFAKTVSKLKTPEERLEQLFLSLYSSYPTKEEKIAFLPEVKTLPSTQAFARAMITSNRFLFVQ